MIAEEKALVGTKEGVENAPEDHFVFKKREVSWTKVVAVIKDKFGLVFSANYLKKRKHDYLPCMQHCLRGGKNYADLYTIWLLLIKEVGKGSAANLLNIEATGANRTRNRSSFGYCVQKHHV